MHTKSRSQFLKALGPEQPTRNAAALPEAARQQTRRSHLYKSFLKDEDGAVTVDWVVLTASIVGIGLIVLIPIAFGTETVVNTTRDTIQTVEVGYQSATP